MSDARPRWRGIQALALAVLTLLCVTLVPIRAGADGPDDLKNDPDLRLRTLETEHFIIHYAAGSQIIAEDLARIAERAWDNVTAALGHATVLKVHVVMSDNSDSPNGSAASIPYPLILIRQTAPESMSVLGNADDYLDTLFTHELTHIIHVGTVHGLPRLINAILGFGVLGKTAAPNSPQPRWVLEGLATDFESRFTSQGRPESAYFRMIARMAVAEDRLTQLDRTTSEGRAYPHGSAVYLYGMLFMGYLVEQHGLEKVAELSHTYGGRLLPFGVSKVIEDIYGVPLSTMWNDFVESTELAFGAELRRIRRRGLRQGRRITFTPSVRTSNTYTRYATWAPDDSSLVIYDDDGHRRPGLFRIDPKGAPIREGRGIGKQGGTTRQRAPGLSGDRVLFLEDGGRAAFLPDGKRFVFDMRGNHGRRYFYSDLYLHEQDGPRKRRQLTFGLRAREPDVAQDGKTVVFSRNDTAQSRLGFLDLDTLETSELEPLHPRQQVYDPRFSPDATRVAYSMWRPGGYRDIYIYDREAETHRAITSDRYNDLAPSWTPDGRYVLFSSDRSGVFNLYAYDLETHSVWEVSNVLGGAFEPNVNHAGDLIAYTGYTSTGFDIWMMPFDPSSWREAPPVVDVYRKAPASLSDLPERPQTLESRAYQPIRTLFPRALEPTFLEFENDGFLTELGVGLGIGDVLGVHALRGRIAYVPEIQDFEGAVGYTFARFVPNLSLGLSRTITQRSSGFTRYEYEPVGPSGGGDYFQQEYLERETRFDAGISVPARVHPMVSANFELQYFFRRLENIDQGDFVVDPNAPATGAAPVGDFAGIALRTSFSNRDSFTFGYRQQVGRAIGLNVEFLDPVLGSSARQIRASGNYTENLPMPWRGHQVLAMRISAGASTGSRTGGLSYSAGGLASEDDVIRTLLTRSGSSPSRPLRGYPTSVFRGNFYTVLNIEYRLPLVDLDRGVSSLPVFLQQIVIVPFFDVGLAWTGLVRFGDFAPGAGGSLIFRGILGYRGSETVNLVFQYARGLRVDEGINYFRALVTTSF